MKKFILMVHIFLAIWALDSWNTLASAQTTTSTCTSKYLIGFFNGVFTTPDAAVETILRLRDEFPATHKGKPLGITRFYNPTDDFGDLAESFKQATQGDLRLQEKWELILLTFHGQNQYLSVIDVLPPEVSFIAKFLVDAWAKKVAQYIPGTAEQTLIKKMQGYMDNKVAVVAVAHSQGNFFADAVYKAIQTRLVTDGFTVKFVHVAPPVSNSQIHSDSGNYFLNKSDLIINLVRKFNPAVVDGTGFALLNMDVALANIDPSVVKVSKTFGTADQQDIFSFPVPPDFFGHFFLETYMNKGFKDWVKVKTAIQTALDDVQDYPCAMKPDNPPPPPPTTTPVLTAAPVFVQYGSLPASIQMGLRYACSGGCAELSGFGVFWSCTISGTNGDGSAITPFTRQLGVGVGFVSGGGGFVSDTGGLVFAPLPLNTASIPGGRSITLSCSSGIGTYYLNSQAVTFAVSDGSGTF